MTWRRREPQVAAAGHVGGDLQVGEAYSASWGRELGGGRWSVVTRAYYVADEGSARSMIECTEYLVCTDPADPGGTEVASSDAHAVVAVGPLDDRAVQAAARESWAPTSAEWNNQMSGWRVPW